jgi:hypothetical protein
MKTLLPLLIFAFSCSIYGQDQTLTNDKIVEMTKAGIPASVIISKIKVSDIKFDTDTPALKALNDAGVPEAVVSTMIERASTVRPETAPAAVPTAVILPASDAIPKERRSSPPFTPLSQLDKASQKQRIKSPAGVSIAAGTDKIQPLLIRAFQMWDYQIENESSRTLLFSKPVPGIGNKMLVGMAMGGNNLRYKIQVSMSEYDGITSVIVSGWVTSDNAFGKTNQESIDRNNKFRGQLDELLLAVKSQAESVQ